jgi:hypothetical protein
MIWSTFNYELSLPNLNTDIYICIYIYLFILNKINFSEHEFSLVFLNLVIYNTHTYIILFLFFFITNNLFLKFIE